MKKAKGKSKLGFTLIELLVVIGIIGILAAGILAAIDPLEQLKKGQDSNKRSICVELFNALTRYYAINSQMPWGAGGTSGTLSDLSGSVISALTAVGELKPEFMQGLPAGAATAISIYQANAGDPIYVCFDPQSKAISADPTTIFSDTSGNTGCDPTAAGASCYWCAR